MSRWSDYSIGTTNVYIGSVYQDSVVTYTGGVLWGPSPGGRPRCLRCGHGEYLARIPYGSKRDGEHICGQCIDLLLRKER